MKVMHGLADTPILVRRSRTDCSINKAPRASRAECDAFVIL